MAFRLTLRELSLFEDVAGVTWTSSQKRFQPRRCQAHRLRDQDAWQECAECEPPDVPMRVLGTMAWIVARRSEPALSYEEFAETADIERITELVYEGNA